MKDLSHTVVTSERFYVTLQRGPFGEQFVVADSEGIVETRACVNAASAKVVCNRLNHGKQA